jgi:FlaA1/EpsC-like NDP-sugar epimerase
LNQTALSNWVQENTILVTGAAGSIGAGLVKEMVKLAPKKLILLDQAESALYELQTELGYAYKNAPFQYLIADIRDKKQLTEIFEREKPSAVFHAAAYKHVPLMEDNPNEAIKTNIQGTKNITDVSIAFGIQKFVFISTDKAVNPTNIMGASKRIAEMYIQSKNETSNTQFITTRFGNVLGSNGSVIPLFQKQIEEGGPITLTDDKITRYFMTIPEACQLVLEAFIMGQGGEIFVFDMGEPMKIIDLAKKMIALNGFEVDKDIEIKITGLRPGEKMYEELLADLETTLPTHHPKILIAQTRNASDSFENRLNTLLSIDDEVTEKVRIMKEIVPEFISENSSYSSLDHA